jgi:hypothetical protein
VLKRMKRVSRIVLVVFTMCIMLTGNVAFAESELQSETIAANSPTAVLTSAGITQAEVTQLGRLQGIIANMVSSGQVTAQQARNIVQQHINNPPTVAQMNSIQNTSIPFQALKSKYADELTDSSTIQPMAIRMYGGSLYEALTYYENDYAPGHGFQQAAGSIILPTGITVAYSSSQQNDYPYMSLSMFHYSPSQAGFDSGIIYQANSAGVGHWYPFIYSFAPGTTDQFSVSFNYINPVTSAIYTTVFLEGNYPNCQVRQIIYDINDGYNILVDTLYNVNNQGSYNIGANNYIMTRTTGMMRINDSAAITGGDFAYAQWGGVTVGSFDSTGGTVGLGTWDTVRGNSDAIRNGNVPGVVSVYNKTPYSQESVSISY